MLVSVAQVLSALELALVIGGDTRGGGVQMIRVDPMMFSQNRGVFGSDVLLHLLTSLFLMSSDVSWHIRDKIYDALNHLNLI